MKWLAAASLLSSLLLLSGCIIDPSLEWRDSAEGNCSQEVTAKQDACLSWVDQSFQAMQPGDY